MVALFSRRWSRKPRKPNAGHQRPSESGTLNGLVGKSRSERLEDTKQWFLANRVEDPIDGTMFDCAVLDAFRELEIRFANAEVEAPK